MPALTTRISSGKEPTVSALRKLREGARLTIYELQRDSGVSSTSIQKIESGGGMNLLTAKKLARALASRLQRGAPEVLVELSEVEAEE